MREQRREAMISGFFFGALIAAVAFCSSVSATERTEIQLPETYEIAKEEILSVTLGALADSIKGDPAMIEALAHLEVSVAPKPGEMKGLSDVNVLYEIRKAKLDYLSIDLR
ncbi:hypothetical protein K8I31_04415, partial [bacterium]|nr:hypothetical protein [bacterium]